MTCRAVFRATKCLQGRPALAVPFMMLPIRASCAMSIRPTFSQNIPSIPFTIQRASLATAEELDDGGEIKDPKIIFNLVWSKLEAQVRILHPTPLLCSYLLTITLRCTARPRKYEVSKRDYMVDGRTG